MYDIRFIKGTNLVAVRVSGHQITFGQVYGNNVRLGTIDGLKLNVGTILKEFPDLQGRSHTEIKRIAIERFKEHVKSLPDEKAVRDYVVQDLEKHGYQKGLEIKNGHRPRK
tara:strand:+ start:1020 stop:1352 length:333 start_codon:yes stop_codon:yes gene_type:complete